VCACLASACCSKASDTCLAAYRCKATVHSLVAGTTWHIMQGAAATSPRHMPPCLAAHSPSCRSAAFKARVVTPSFCVASASFSSSCLARCHRSERVPASASHLHARCTHRGQTRVSKSCCLIASVGPAARWLCRSITGSHYMCGPVAALYCGGHCLLEHLLWNT
jgi:hypothetical protein